MKKTTVNTVILGAGFFGISALINASDNTLLIERGVRIGNEFSSAFTVNRYEKLPLCEFAKSFLQELDADGFVKDGYISSVPAAFLLAKKCEDKNIMFKTEVTSIDYDGTKYLITVFNSDGYSEITASRIIDTTPEGIFFTEKAEEKFLNVLCEKETENSVYDVFTGHYVMSFKAQCGEEIHITRQRLYEYLQKNNIGAIYIADDYSYKIQKTKKQCGERYYHIPSAGFNDIIDAVDNGGYAYDGI